MLEPHLEKKPVLVLLIYVVHARRAQNSPRASEYCPYGFPSEHSRTAFNRAREETQRAALVEQQARTAAEAATAAAEKGPSQHEEDMFEAKAILQAAVSGLEGK